MKPLVHGKRTYSYADLCKRTEWDNQTAILTIGTDLTQKTKAEKVLNESLEENRRILDNLQMVFPCGP